MQNYSPVKTRAGWGSDYVPWYLAKSGGKSAIPDSSLEFTPWHVLIWGRAHGSLYCPITVAASLWMMLSFL